MYIANNLKAIPRPDIKFDLELVESCWVQIDAGKNNKTLIIGCIYKHPTCNLEQFRNQLSNIIKILNPNSREIDIFGDINIDFLKYNEHSQTEEFLDMLFANNVLPIITKPTTLTDHTATLIDHIYTNSLQYFTSGILTVDVTDHLPIFCVIETQPPRNNNKRYLRDYSKFKNELFLDDIKSHCLRKPGRAKRWGSADFKDILVMQSLSHMNTNGRRLRNFKSFLSENDHPPLVFYSDEASNYSN